MFNFKNRAVDFFGNVDNRDVVSAISNFPILEGLNSHKLSYLQALATIETISEKLNFKDLVYSNAPNSFKIDVLLSVSDHLLTAKFPADKKSALVAQLITTSKHLRVHDSTKEALIICDLISRKQAVISPEDRIENQYQICKIIWDRDMKDRAVFELQRLVTNIAITQHHSVRFHLTLAKWKHTRNAEGIQSLVDNHIMPTITAIQNSNQSELKAKSFKHLADYSFSLVEESKDVEMIEAYKKIIEQKSKELAALEGKNTREDSIARSNKQRQINADKALVKELQKRQESALINALIGYIKALRHSNKYDWTVFRLVSLLFKYENFEGLSDLKTHFFKIPAHKFVTVAHQLSAHIVCESKNLSEIIDKTLYQMNMLHPYHTFWHIVAIMKNTVGRNSNITRSATQLVDRLRAGNPNLFNKLIFLSDAYMEIADLKPPSKDGRDIPRNCRFLKRDAFRNVPIITDQFDVRADANYSELPYIAKVEAKYRLVGGINAPKLVSVTDNSGVTHLQVSPSFCFC